LSKSRRKHSAKEKSSIVKRHLLDKESVSDICDDIDIAPTQYYRWQKEFVDNAEVVFEKRDRKSNAQIRRLEEEVEKLKSRLKHKDSVIAEITEDYVKLKKNFGET
jgi:transposase-like protein